MTIEVDFPEDMLKGYIDEKVSKLTKDYFFYVWESRGLQEQLKKVIDAVVIERARKVIEESESIDSEVRAALKARITAQLIRLSKGEA